MELTSVEFDTNELIAAQHNDDDLLKVIKFIQTKSTDKIHILFRRCKSKLFIEDGFLKYKHKDNCCTIVTREMRENILDLAHSKWFSGHLGIFKTHRRILDLFW